MLSARINQTGRRSFQRNRRPAGSLAGIRFYLLAVSLVFTAVPALAQSPILTLAKAQNTEPGPGYRTVRNVIAPTPQTAVEKRLTLDTDATRPALTANVKATDVRLERPAERGMANPLQLNHRNLANYGRPKVWATVNAGFGKIFEEKPLAIYGRNGTGWEEPSCGYLRVNLSF